MLFTHLPDEIFQALSGSNKALIEAVLFDLSDVFYDHAEDPIKKSQPSLKRSKIRSINLIP